MLKLLAPQIAAAMLTVRDVISLYLRHSKATGLHCPQPLAQREHILGLFVEHLGDTPVDDCKAFMLSDWIEAHEGWRSSVTKRSKAAMIKAAFQWAADGERIQRNPFKTVRYAESERRPDLRDEDLKILESLANKKYETVLRFLRLTGCRIGELCEAKWPDIDLDRGIWTIDKHKTRKKTKRAKMIALVPEAVQLLIHVAGAIAPVSDTLPMKSLLASQADSFVFLNTRGRPWSIINLGQQINRLKRRHGLTFKASLHGIRHRFGSASVAAGAPIMLVSKQMGHASVTTTQKYYVDLSEEMDAIRNAAQLGQPKA